MKIEIIKCDCCGKNRNWADKDSESGNGSLRFRYSQGSHGGGNNDIIEMPDLCLTCMKEIRKHINIAIKDLKSKMVKIKDEKNI